MLPERIGHGLLDAQTFPKDATDGAKTNARRSRNQNVVAAGLTTETQRTQMLVESSVRSTSSVSPSCTIRRFRMTMLENVQAVGVPAPGHSVYDDSVPALTLARHYEESFGCAQDKLYDEESA